MTRLSDTLQRSNNNFDLVRLIASLAVIFGHSFWILPTNGRVEPILKFTKLEYSGSLAVYAFFLMSGILVSKSFDTQRSRAVFALHRAARIYPAFAVCTIFTAFVLGPIISTLPARQYFADPMTKYWWWHTITLMFGVGNFLPGVFPNTPIKSLVNATMWTLPVEVKCYLVVFVTGICGAIGSRWRTVVACTIVGIGLVLLATHKTGNWAIDDIVIVANGYTFYPVAMFLFGMLAYAFRESIVLDWRISLALIVAYFATNETRLGHVLFYVMFAYSVLTFASLKALRFKLPGDYSFGLYLWGFVVHQCVASAYPKMDNYVSVLIAIPITLLIAIASWHLIEKPAIDWVKNASSRRPLVTSRPEP